MNKDIKQCLVSVIFIFHRATAILIKIYMKKKCNSILMHFKIQFWSSIIKQMEYGKEPHNKIGNEIKEIKS
jgi:hypothetical protein